MRHRPRLDGNHNQIVKALRQAGCFVQSLASIGAGCPDLLVVRCGKIYLIEIKDPKQPPSKQRLTADESDWISKCKCTVHIVRTIQEALDAVSL